MRISNASPLLLAALSLGALTVAVACGEANTAETTSDLSANLPCDVQSIVATKCQQCHDRKLKAGAPMPLASAADWQRERRGKKVLDLAKERIADPARPMPPGQPLPDEERRVLDGWLASGAPAGACAPKAETPKEAPPCQADTSLKASEPFTMGMKDDEYVCYGVDVTRTSKRHVTAMVPEVDNETILHHILVFQAPESVSAAPHPCESFGASEWKLVGGWAPGGKSIVFPEETGFPEEVGTTHWVVQLHYNNVSRKVGETDHSGFGLCTTDQLRPNDSGIVAFGALRFAIPPRRGHAVTCDFPLDERFQNVKFFGGSPHMHKLGSALFMDRLPAGGGSPQSVIKAQSFDFQEQRGLPLDVRVGAGDTIRTRCEWKNPTDRAVKFGEGTESEMCFGFVSYYPAIADQYTTVAGRTAPVFNWTTPSNNLPVMDAVRTESGLAIPSPTCREEDL